jgi:hypothetical protein
MLGDSICEVDERRAEQFAVGLESHGADRATTMLAADDLEELEDRAGPLRFERKDDFLTDDRAMDDEDTNHGGKI